MKNSSKQSVKMDMLHGSLFDKMLMFAMPLAACSILQQLFNSVGTAVVGRFASSEALAAVGSNSSVIALMVTLFSGISLGSNVVIANYIGQNDTKRIPRVVHTAVSLALLSGVFLLILGWVHRRISFISQRYICGFIFLECHFLCYMISVLPFFAVSEIRVVRCML